jgi:hypothetical protein
MWNTVKVNGEAVAPEHKDQFGQQIFATELYADVLETVVVEHDTAGVISCTVCGECWDLNDDHDEAARELCPQGDTGEEVHVLAPAPLTWFEEARVSVNEGDESVRVQITASGKRFAITVHYAENVGEHGSLVLTLPGTSGTREVDGVTVIAD